MGCEEHVQYIERLHVHGKYNSQISQFVDAMTIYYDLFNLLNTVLNLLNIPIYVVDILRGSHNIVSNIDRVQWAHSIMKNY